MVVGIDASRANKAIRTGTEWYSYHIIEELKQIIPAEVSVRLYTRESLLPDLATLPVNWEVRILKWPPKYLWTLVRLSFEMFQHPPDVLFIPAHGLPLLLPKATINTIHDVGFERFPKLYKKRQVVYHRFAVRRALARATRIITISEFTRSEIEALFGKKQTPVDVIPLAQNDKEFFFPPEDTRLTPVLAQYHIQQPYFFFIGRLEQKKNIGRMIEAFSVVHQSHPDAQFVFVGSWGYGKEAFEETVGRLHLSQAVHFLRWVPQKDVAPLMTGAVAMVFPTLYEGFGIPLLESMAVGTPVITSRGGAHEEVAGEAALLVDPRSTTDIARAMMAVLNDSSQVEVLRQKGITRVKQFSWQKTAQETWRVLKIAANQTL